MDDSSRVELFRYDGPYDDDFFKEVTRKYMALNIEETHVSIRGVSTSDRMVISVTVPTDHYRQNFAHKEPIEDLKCNKLPIMENMRGDKIEIPPKPPPPPPRIFNEGPFISIRWVDKIMKKIKG